MTSESRERHQQAAAERGPVPVGIVTVSDSRTPETDQNGTYLREAVVAAGHTIVGYRLVRDEQLEVLAALEAFSNGHEARALIFNGGTGIARRDRTYDALSAKMDKVLPGFGELFRMLSYEQVGAAAMLSRATAGIYEEMVVFSVPGSPAAVRLAWEKLIEPELEHLVWELTR